MTTTLTDKPIQLSPLRPAAVLALVSLPVFIGALDLTIVSAVLPAVINDLGIPFNTGANEAAWIVTGYLLAYTISMLFFGRISDLIGRRRTYLIALLIFILGSWLVAIARGAPANIAFSIARLLQSGRPDRAFVSLYTLIASRVIQALGAGALVPTSMALVADLYPQAKRATPLGVVAAVDTAGWVLGHLYGGVMVQWVEWPVLFWLNVPLTTVALILIWRMLRPLAQQSREGDLGKLASVFMVASLLLINVEAAIEIAHAAFPNIESIRRAGGAVLTLTLDVPGVLLTMAALLLSMALAGYGARHMKTVGRPDWVGTLLVSLSLLGLNVALAAGGELGSGVSFEQLAPPPAYALPMLIGAGLLLVAFAFSQSRIRQPLINLQNFRKRNLALACGINLLIGFCLMIGLVSVPLFINTLVYPPPDIDRAALTSGILLGGLTIPMALAAVPGGWLTERIGYRIPTTFGLALSLAGFFLARTWTPTTPEITMATHLAIAGIGLGLAATPVATAVINAVQASERGMAAALVLIMRLIGMTISTSTMTSFGLRRWSALNQRVIAAGATDLVSIANTNFTQTINEMLIIAALICLLALLPALFMRARDAVPT